MKYKPPNEEMNTGGQSGKKILQDSDLLTTMCHELRTPVNSMILLSNLLMENRDQNLNDEQLEYSRVIHCAGNNLLEIINNVLDLSKMEAGEIILRREHVDIYQLSEEIKSLFHWQAKEEDLTFTWRIEEGIDDRIETDRLRVEQILKNLISNAFKFTERGRIDVSIHTDRDNYLAFQVTDTGIGISTKRQEMIFKAFKQADEEIYHLFGGTGLGLAISLRTARLLDGTIELESKEGTGSTFTLYLPYRPVNESETSRTYRQGTQDEQDHQRVQREKKRDIQEDGHHVNHITDQQDEQNEEYKSVQAKGEEDRTDQSKRYQLTQDKDSSSSSFNTLLLVDDSRQHNEALKEYLAGMADLILTSRSKNETIEIIESKRIDLIVLDMKLNDTSGLDLLKRIRLYDSYKQTPVIIYTGKWITVKEAEVLKSLGAVILYKSANSHRSLKESIISAFL